LSASEFLLNLWHGKVYSTTGSGDRTKAIQAKKIRYLSLDVDERVCGCKVLCRGHKPVCWREIRFFDGLEELVLVVWRDYMKHYLMTLFRRSMEKEKEREPGWVVPRIVIVFVGGERRILCEG